MVLCTVLIVFHESFVCILVVDIIVNYFGLKAVSSCETRMGNNSY